VTTFTPPEIDYVAIAPILIVAIAALLSVLTETFLPRPVRRPVQLMLTFLSLIGAFVVVVINRDIRTTTGGGAVAIDGPALVLMGTILILSLLSAFLIAERSLDSLGDAFAPSAAALPGSVDEREFSARGYFQTEIWTLSSCRSGHARVRRG